jgi:hypothetical protein
LRRDAGPALPAARGWLALLDAGGEAGEILADAPELGLDHRHHRGGEFDPGPGEKGLDQHQQNLAEPVCRGKGGGVVHVIKLVWVATAGQVEFSVSANGRKKSYPQMTQMMTSDGRR